ncbi:chromate transporter [Aureibacter tunicatorum]|uniref:Chromate transporter n=1 Tax=Aureibacter tunicatorum TaxID=866807 RepID=A0AAE3XNC0_9BACT|nr:chromate transporter [Aureibacter tunicatorum]MDR6240122.1 chromate transporter [Aureibacter tunicatorum]BDD05997.1 chromate transporter [Aureibacter tunicatorum]
MKKLIDLFISFFKLGAMTIGGGYAMIPLLEDLLVNKKKWLTKEDMLEIISISQMTPGTIAINAATFIGYRIKGKTGAVTATAGVITPSLIIITTIALIFSSHFESQLLQNAFKGIRCAVVAMIGYSVYGMLKSGIKNAPQVLIFAASLVLLVAINVNPIYLIIIGGATSILVQLFIPSLRKHIK